MNWAMDDLMARATGQLEALYQVQERIGGVRVTEESPGGHVCATVDGSGGLVHLHLGPTSRRLGAAGLADAIVTTATRAARRALAHRAAITTDFLSQFAADNATRPDNSSATPQLDARS